MNPDCGALLADLYELIDHRDPVPENFSRPFAFGQAFPLSLPDCGLNPTALAIQSRPITKWVYRDSEGIRKLGCPLRSDRRSAIIRS
jgi:hypothetical protein